MRIFFDWSFGAHTHSGRIHIRGARSFGAHILSVRSSFGAHAGVGFGAHAGVGFGAHAGVGFGAHVGVGFGAHRANIVRGAYLRPGARYPLYE